MEKTMSDVTLFGFPRSVYVQMAGIVLTHKEVPYTFHDLEAEMNAPSHLALHPFERVPILRHGDFTVYETAAIVAYADDAFDGATLTPGDARQRARMNQWISAVNGYYYPYLIYHVSHERNVFPQLGAPGCAESASALSPVGNRAAWRGVVVSRVAPREQWQTLGVCDAGTLPLDSKRSRNRRREDRAESFVIGTT
jgi:glutathione S-transferase